MSPLDAITEALKLESNWECAIAIYRAINPVLMGGDIAAGKEILNSREMGYAHDRLGDWLGSEEVELALSFMGK